MNRGREHNRGADSTKNATQTRDPDMKQALRGKNWHFGMKLHIGAEKRGLVHTVAAAVSVNVNLTRGRQGKTDGMDRSSRLDKSLGGPQW